MKLLSRALVAAGVVALAACSGGDDAANNVGADTLTVAPDDLGDENLIVDDLGNDLGLDNTTLNATENAVDTNTAGNTL